MPHLAKGGYGKIPVECASRAGTDSWSLTARLFVGSQTGIVYAAEDADEYRLRVFEVGEDGVSFAFIAINEND